MSLDAAARKLARHPVYEAVPYAALPHIQDPCQLSRAAKAMGL